MAGRFGLFTYFGPHWPRVSCWLFLVWLLGASRRILGSVTNSVEWLGSPHATTVVRGTVTRSFSVREIGEIPKGVELIRDGWLDADSISFDSEKAILRLRYLKSSGQSPFVNRLWFPAMECFLIVRGVSSYSVKDDQKVRFYDIEALSYDPAAKRIRLKTGIPLEVSLVVVDLDLTIEETGTLVES